MFIQICILVDITLGYHFPKKMQKNFMFLYYAEIYNLYKTNFEFKMVK